MATPTTLAGTAFTPQELVEGVQNMQVVFGENVGAAVPQAIRYVPPAPVTAPAVAVTDYADVQSVRVWLMVRSEDSITETTQGSLAFAGTTYTPPDKRLRKVFSTTVGLRNRIN